ncbi:MAG: ATP-binding cassette domain-containing protein [Spirochaetota bacterium]
MAWDEEPLMLKLERLLALMEKEIILVMTLMEGQTSFVIAQRLSTIRDAELILVVDSGSIAECGFGAGLHESQFAVTAIEECLKGRGYAAMDTTDIVRVEGLSRRFGSVTAVDGISLSIRRGEVFALLGPNGAGKTTTINMLCGLLAPDSGTIAITTRQGFPGTGRSVGLCPQSIMVWDSLTCLEQLVFMARMYDLPGTRARLRAGLLLEVLGLAEKRNKLARTLSGGMQRRLNIALALVHEPELLVLDEPQAGLDPQSRVLVRDYLRSIRDEVTILLTTHDMEEADKLSDRVAIMDKGRILVVDRPERLKQRSGAGGVLELSLPADAGEQGQTLVDRLKAEGFEVTAESGKLVIPAGEGDSSFVRVLALARELGLPVEELRVRKRSLEDVFIELTGRGLRE